jgi:hypothetical protein
MPEGDTVTDVARHSWWRAQSDGTKTALIAAAASLIVGGMAAIATIVAAQVGDDPNGPSRSLPQQSPTSSSLADPQGPVFSESIDIDLSSATAIPQRSWSADTLSATEGVGDFAVECRHRENPLKRCRVGEPAVYHLLPDRNRGIEAGRVNSDPTASKDVCLNAKLSSLFLPIREGGFYCVRTETRLVGILVESLPPANPPRP